jgi:hypothetical protein
LYSDSTFRFKESVAMPFPHSTLRKGYYSFSSNEIHLNQLRRLHFIIPFKALKFKELVFAMDEKHIYLFDKKSVSSSSANKKEFVQVYYTLYLSDRG